jgi:nucleoside phosphorylase
MTFTHSDYTIGWICALPLEMAAAKAALDELHPRLPASLNDHNLYTLGAICGHNIAIACLPAGVYGTTSAAIVATHLTSTFAGLRYSLMVGIAGGVPHPSTTDIRLGDIVVSKPTGTNGGVIQYDYGKTLTSGRSHRTGCLNKPPAELLAALATLESDHLLGQSTIPVHLAQIQARFPAFASPDPQYDFLFDPLDPHVGGSAEECHPKCEKSRHVPRPQRGSPGPRVHYGLIASGNQVMRDAVTRDSIARQLEGVLCFEMEAAGLMDQFPCLVVRGICDYADSHKSKRWQAYAAATAAAYAKELLGVIPVQQRGQQTAGAKKVRRERLKQV